MPMISDEDKNLVMHIELPILCGHLLMGAYAPAFMGFTVNNGNNVCICPEPDSREKTKTLFDALEKGGRATMPLLDMFWDSYYGTFIDRFGVQWMFNYTGD